MASVRRLRGGVTGSRRVEAVLLAVAVMTRSESKVLVVVEVEQRPPSPTSIASRSSPSPFHSISCLQPESRAGEEASELNAVCWFVDAYSEVEVDVEEDEVEVEKEEVSGLSTSLNAKLGISGDREVMGGEGSGNRQVGKVGRGTERFGLARREDGRRIWSVSALFSGWYVIWK